MTFGKITQSKVDQLQKRMEALGVCEDDLTEKFVKGSGSGGQKVNKTSSCVYLHHHPSGIEIKCQQERSQAMNRYYARKELCERLAEAIEGEKSRRQQEREKVRRQKRRRSRRAKNKMLDAKSKQGDKKKMRGPVKSDD